MSRIACEALESMKFQYNDTIPARAMKLEQLRKAMLDLCEHHREGEGSPEGVVAAPVGTTYTRSDGTPGATFYVKESGTGDTGWAAK